MGTKTKVTKLIEVFEAFSNAAMAIENHTYEPRSFNPSCMMSGGVSHERTDFEEERLRRVHWKSIDALRDQLSLWSRFDFFILKIRLALKLEKWDRGARVVAIYNLHKEYKSVD